MIYIVIYHDRAGVDKAPRSAQIIVRWPRGGQAVARAAQLMTEGHAKRSMRAALDSVPAGKG